MCDVIVGDITQKETFDQLMERVSRYPPPNDEPGDLRGQSSPDKEKHTWARVIATSPPWGTLEKEK
jgi:hypothetical protein